MVYIAPRLLPSEVVKASAACAKASAAYDKARDACAPEINALLARLILDCPWDGERIVFP